MHTYPTVGKYHIASSVEEDGFTGRVRTADHIACSDSMGIDRRRYWFQLILEFQQSQYLTGMS